MKKQIAPILLFTLAICGSLRGQETLPPLQNGKAPHTFEAAWAEFDPRAEPLDIEVIKEWEQDGIVLRIVRYRIGIFKGQKAMMAAVHGFPKGAAKLPGLVQIHGGGQYADANAVITNAKRGYATISIAWAGRINAPGYSVNEDGVKLFWDGKTDNPNYRVTTDWGALDAYHAPCRNPKNAFAHVAPEAWTLDAVESPRNNPWFLVTLGARRALTFLEQQPEVNADKLGVYGHSMGGKLTVMTAGSDQRVKAAAPSCGGMSDRPGDNALYSAAIADRAYLTRISCPIMFLSPSNDFHGRIDDLQKSITEIKSKEWRVTCSPHHNHQDTAEYEVATQLWFDQFLKGAFSFPATPKHALELKTKSGAPVFTVTPDATRPILSVDVFYTQHGQKLADGTQDHEHTMARFWHHAAAVKRGDSWSADLPLPSTDKSLWAYANVVYALDAPVTGAGYYYGTYTTKQFNLSSLMAMQTSEDLKAAGARPTLQPSLVIETFEGDWEKEWFSYKPQDWSRTTHKLYDATWKAPEGAKLAFEVLSKEDGKLVMSLDDHVSEVFLTGGDRWQKVTFAPSDFHDNKGGVMTTWDGVRVLTINPSKSLGPRVIDGKWNDAASVFRNLRWDISTE